VILTLLVVPFPKPHPWTAPVLANEFHTFCRQSVPNGSDREGRYLPSFFLEIDYCRQSQISGIRKLALRDF
jgi:hypothetical protein